MDCSTLEMTKDAAFVNPGPAPLGTACKKRQVLGRGGMHPVVLATNTNSSFVKTDAMGVKKSLPELRKQFLAFI